MLLFTFARAEKATALGGRLFLLTPVNGCSPAYDSFDLTRNARLDRSPVPCSVLGVASNPLGALAWLDLESEGAKATYSRWRVEYGFVDRVGPYFEPQFADLVLGKSSSLPEVRFKALKTQEGKPLLRSDLAVSGDGLRVAFNSSVEYGAQNVLVRDRQGNLLATLTDASWPTWTREGRLLTVCSPTLADIGSGFYDDRLCLHDLKTKTRKTFTFKIPFVGSPSERLVNLSIALEQLSLSPDGKKLAFVVRRNCGSGECTNTALATLWTSKLDGSDVQPALTLEPALSSVTNVQAPVWSPDGKTLVVSLNGYLAFIDVASRKLTGSSSLPYGLRVYDRPVWLK